MPVASLEQPQHALRERSRAREAIAIMIGQLTPQGGSERQLYLFLAACDRERWAPVVYVSGALGSWEGRIRELGIPVVLLRGHPLCKNVAVPGSRRRAESDVFFLLVVIHQWFRSRADRAERPLHRLVSQRDVCRSSDAIWLDLAMDEHGWRLDFHMQFA